VTAAIALDTADGAMDLYEALPDGTPRGAVIVIQEAFGVNDHIQDVTRRCAAAGYHAVAPALFHCEPARATTHSRRPMVGAARWSGLTRISAE
jgi:dienelactone hydrolase